MRMHLSHSSGNLLRYMHYSVILLMLQIKVDDIGVPKFAVAEETTSEILKLIVLRLILPTN